MRPLLRIPSDFPQTNVRRAFGRDWIWPAADIHGWSHPLEHWPEIEEAILSVFGSPIFGNRKGIALQAGGCCGMYPWLLLHHFEKVLTFELDQFNFHCLVQNCPSPRIIAANLALSDNTRMVGVDRRWEGNCGNHHLKEGNEIPAIIIDNLGLLQLDALFLDAEASEEAIIGGGVMTIARCQPQLIVVETVTDMARVMLETMGYSEKPDSGYDKVFIRNLAENLTPPPGHSEGEPNLPAE